MTSLERRAFGGALAADGDLDEGDDGQLSYAPRTNQLVLYMTARASYRRCSAADHAPSARERHPRALAFNGRLPAPAARSATVAGTPQ